VASYLESHPLQHGELAVLARELEVSARTILNWRRGGGNGRPGRRRPAHVLDRGQAREWIEPRWKMLARGHDGVRTTRAKLEGDQLYVPVRLVREIVSELKLERARREEQRILDERVSVRVLCRDGLWALDQMHLGRDEHAPIHALVANDCCTQRIVGCSLGPPAKGRDVVALLDHAVAERGGKYPFVLQVDNGSENANALVRAWASEHEVILLFNLPHTPQHNPRAERTNGSLKLASGLDGVAMAGAKPLEGPVRCKKVGVLATRTAIAVRLANARHALNACTSRASLGNLTPCELDRIAPRAEDQACRARFYRDVYEELERIARLALGKRARRKQSREAIWCALQQYGLVNRTRGGLPVPAFKSEVNS